MSVTVVNRGLETRAGSNLKRFSIRGSIPPSVTETSVLAANAPPTTNPRYGFAFQKKATPPNSNPSIRPFIIPIFASFATDGIDGKSDAAGAVADGFSLVEARKKDLDPSGFLKENNSYNFFKRLDDLFMTGPTGTNVMDIQVIVISI